MCSSQTSAQSSGRCGCRFTDVQRQLEAGENVILLANHQTEADPGVFALLLEASHPTLATEVIYVAGVARAIFLTVFVS